jgi:hypothetical protein
MLMTPWLAAGAGVVVAAALALHVPHAELTYTPSDPGACSLAECGAVAGGTVEPAHPAGHGPAAALRQGRKGRTARRRRAAGQDPARPGRLRVRYQTVRAGPAGFTGLITLSGRAVQGSWQLTFRYPGARVQSIDGAAWTIRDGMVIVTGPGESAAGHRTAEFTLQASGPPSGPIQCTFDGVACTVR